MHCHVNTVYTVFWLSIDSLTEISVADASWLGFPGSTSGREPSCQCRRYKRSGIWSLGGEDPLEKGTATHPSVLAWRTPRTEEPGGLWLIGSQRVRHDWSDLAHMYTSRLRWIMLQGTRECRYTSLRSRFQAGWTYAQKWCWVLSFFKGKQATES